MKLLQQHLPAAGLLSLLAAGTCAASIVYQATYSGAGLPYYSSPNAYGDEIVLAGTDRVMTDFHFAYFSDYSLPAGLSFKLYENNGPPVSGFPSPGGVLYSDTLDVIAGPGGVDVDVAFPLGLLNALPDRLTFVVQFLDMAQHGSAGLLLADFPNIGASGNDFWEDDAWELRQLPGYNANFEARVIAVTIPEATPGAAAAIALVGWGLFAGYRRVRHPSN